MKNKHKNRQGGDEQTGGGPAGSNYINRHQQQSMHILTHPPLPQTQHHQTGRVNASSSNFPQNVNVNAMQRTHPPQHQHSLFHHHHHHPQQASQHFHQQLPRHAVSHSLDNHHGQQTAPSPQAAQHGHARTLQPAQPPQNIDILSKSRNSIDLGSSLETASNKAAPQNASSEAPKIDDKTPTSPRAALLAPIQQHNERHEQEQRDKAAASNTSSSKNVNSPGCTSRDLTQNPSLQDQQALIQRFVQAQTQQQHQQQLHAALTPPSQQVRLPAQAHVHAQAQHQPSQQATSPNSTSMRILHPQSFMHHVPSHTIGQNRPSPPQIHPMMQTNQLHLQNLPHLASQPVSAPAHQQAVHNHHHHHQQQQLVRAQQQMHGLQQQPMPSPPRLPLPLQIQQQQHMLQTYSPHHFHPQGRRSSRGLAENIESNALVPFIQPPAMLPLAQQHAMQASLTASPHLLPMYGTHAPAILPHQPIQPYAPPPQHQHHAQQQQQLMYHPSHPLPLPYTPCATAASPIGNTCTSPALSIPPYIPAAAWCTLGPCGCSVCRECFGATVRSVQKLQIQNEQGEVVMKKTFACPACGADAETRIPIQPIPIEADEVAFDAKSDVTVPASGRRDDGETSYSSQGMYAAVEQGARTAESSAMISPSTSMSLSYASTSTTETIETTSAPPTPDASHYCLPSSFGQARLQRKSRSFVDHGPSHDVLEVEEKTEPEFPTLRPVPPKAKKGKGIARSQSAVEPTSVPKTSPVLRTCAIVPPKQAVIPDAVETDATPTRNRTRTRSSSFSSGTIPLGGETPDEFILIDKGQLGRSRSQSFSQSRSGSESELMLAAKAEDNKNSADVPQISQMDDSGTAEAVSATIESTTTTPIVESKTAPTQPLTSTLSSSRNPQAHVPAPHSRFFSNNSSFSTSTSAFNPSHRNDNFLRLLPENIRRDTQGDWLLKLETTYKSTWWTDPYTGKAAALVPDNERQANTPPTSWPVVKVHNVAFKTTAIDLERWLPPNTLPPKHLHPQAIHFITDLATGKSAPIAFIECIDEAAAQRLVDERDLCILDKHEISFRLTTQTKLALAVFATLYPHEDPELFGKPLLEGYELTDREYSTNGDEELFPAEDAAKLNKVIDAVVDSEGGQMNYDFFTKPAERPFMRIVTLVTKFPWHTVCSTPEQVDRLYKLVLRALDIIPKQLRTMYHARDVCEALCRAVAACPAFDTVRKARIAAIWQDLQTMPNITSVWRDRSEGAQLHRLSYADRQRRISQGAHYDTQTPAAQRFSAVDSAQRTPQTASIGPTATLRQSGSASPASPLSAFFNNSRGRQVSIGRNSTGTSDEGRSRQTSNAFNRTEGENRFAGHAFTFTSNKTQPQAATQGHERQASTADSTKTTGERSLSGSIGKNARPGYQGRHFDPNYLFKTGKPVTEGVAVESKAIEVVPPPVLTKAAKKAAAALLATQTDSKDATKGTQAGKRK